MPATAVPSRPRLSFAGRGRATLLWGAALFLVGQLALAVAIEWRFSELRDPPYGYKEHRLLRRLAAVRPPPRTVVMLGSSRTLNALDAEEAERELAGPDGTPLVFNFGIAGTGPVTELLTLRRLLARGVRPDLLLVEVMPPLLAAQVPVADLTWLEPGRLWHSDLALLERYRPGARLRASWWEGWPVPCHSHRFALVSALSPGLLPLPHRFDCFGAVDDLGWRPVSAPRGDPRVTRAAIEHAHQAYAEHLNGFRLGGPNVAALRELLEVCRAEGISTVLVLMPEGSEFRSWYPPAARAQIEDFLAGLRRDCGADVVDARLWLADEDFVDGHHPYPEGAAHFSARLAREVIAPRLGRASATSRTTGEFTTNCQSP
jgi:hypothetical protein